MSQMEKTEKATPYKLEKNREKGQVSKSVDLTAVTTLATAILLITVFWQKDLRLLSMTTRQYLISIAQFNVSIDSITALFNHALRDSLWMLSPFALVLTLVIVIITILQSGFVFSTQPLVPNFKRLNPVSGVKKLWSVKLAFDSGKNCIKLLVASILIGRFILQHMKEFGQFTYSAPTTYPYHLMHILITLACQLCFLLAVFALLDLLFTRWKYGRDNRMSKQEIKDEHKQREGDPKIKAKIRQLQKDFRARTASVQQVKEADVLITNPTHIAIALKYDRLTMPAPKVICKAAGDLAAIARREARKYQIRIIEDKPFARALFQAVQLNQYIDETFFPVAAAIYNQLYKQQRPST